MNSFVDMLLRESASIEELTKEAKNSEQLFVRSQDHLSLDNQAATGRRLSASEALSAFGKDVLIEALEYGSAMLPQSERKPSATLRARREELGLTVHALSRATGIDADHIEDCEDAATRSPIRNLEKVASHLGLDERKLSFSSDLEGDKGLAARLKTLSRKGQHLNAGTVAALSEASWVVSCQHRLAGQLGYQSGLLGRFEPSHNYGEPGYPVWLHGCYLAQETRKSLNLSENGPIPSMRELCQALGIPLIQTEFAQPHIAGATVDNNGKRGIVVNLRSNNENVWVRRTTIAHELGHLLWDPVEKLNKIRVDDFRGIESLSRQEEDYVEARANAFAIEFLAPSTHVAKVFLDSSGGSEGLRKVMETFGISRTAAAHHIPNALERDSLREELLECRVDSEPTDDWKGRENLTTDYFPFRKTQLSRRGLFSKYVVEANRKKLLPQDTALSYLDAEQEEYERHQKEILDLF